MSLLRHLLLGQAVYGKISELYEPIAARLLLWNKFFSQKQYCME